MQSEARSGRKILYNPLLLRLTETIKKNKTIMLKFTLHNKAGHARRGTLELNHGSIETPVFMPVGTYGSVKAMTPAKPARHQRPNHPRQHLPLWLRPGLEVIEQFGGLHDFIGWNKPILTDSGGFQVFSLSRHAQTHRRRLHLQKPD